MSEYAIKVEHVRKTFKIPHERYTSLKQSMVNVWRPRRYSLLEAIEDVSFEIKPGEFFSIIGQNGSGKSTLLKILAGIYTPTSGTIHVNGRLSPFIELGVGFNPELTARENIFLNGAILGLTRDEIVDKFNEIIEFAELAEFIDQKLKNFSSGMLVRLAFSVAIQAHAEILLIDEVLAVGDANFQQKCYDVFRELKASGRTIIFVSHDLGSVKEFSDRVLVLNAGVDYGIFSAEEAIAKYSDLNQARTNKELERLGIVDTRPSQKGLGISAIKLLNSDGQPTHAVKRGEKVSVNLQIDNPNLIPVDLGVSIYRNDKFYCFGTNTVLDKVKLQPSHHMSATITYPSLNLQKGSYYLTVGLFGHGGQPIYDMLENVLEFQVLQIDGYEGLVLLDHVWEANEI